MKIEMAPWAKAYAVDIDKLYTELTLKKIENEPSGPRGTKFTEYTKLFEDKLISASDRANQCSTTKTTIVKHRRKKVLIKGHPGKGKTTLMKKMGWDWAAGIFKKFSIFFFIFLKLVRPQETIENVIIHHHPILKATNTKPSRLKQILETFGDRCLIIFDGLDEHALGKNQDVLEIIRGEKLPYCSIVVTSRPHCTAQFEQYFHTIAQVDGFTEEKARQFAMCILKDNKKVEAILNYSPSWDFSSMFHDKLFQTPILLLFLCILVKENEFDLEKEHSNWTGFGALYFRLSKCLYRKFTERKGISYVEEEFLDVIARIGKLAWKMFTSKERFQKSNVIDIVGADAFDYGFLIGHEDYRLFGDETADVIITFVHRSLQDFYGAFYFIWSLLMGRKIKALVGSDGKRSQILTNPLLLQFCLVFTNRKYFPRQASRYVPNDHFIHFGRNQSGTIQLTVHTR